MLRVHFCDNDFSSVVSDACESLMYTIANGHQGYNAEVQLGKCVKEYGLEKLRKAIVVSSYGYYIVRKASDLYDDSKLIFEDKDFILDYLDKNITLEEVEMLNPDDFNSETCYMEFFSLEVHLV